MASLSGKILVVDDDDNIRHLICRFLGENGYSVHEACTGAQALLIWADHKSQIDLLVTNFSMPGMNGMELAARLKTEKPELKVILETGSYHSTIRESARAGKFTHLPKPFHSSELVGLVQNMMTDGKGAHEEGA